MPALERLALPSPKTEDPVDEQPEVMIRRLFLLFCTCQEQQQSLAERACLSSPPR